MKINAKKSSCIRFGKAYSCPCALITVGGTPWSDSIKYLGITLKSACKFSVDMRNVRTNFYKCFNAIYCNISKANEDVIISLVKSICLPSLLYCVEVLNLNVSTLRSLDTPLYHAFGKVFKIFDNNILNDCMLYMNFLPPRFEYYFRRIKFLKKTLNAAIC
jgi:hypothetical protein